MTGKEMPEKKPDDAVPTMILDPEFQKDFAKNVIEHAERHRISHMEAVISICEEAGIEDFSSVKDLITPRIREEIEKEAINRHLFPKPQTNRLPI